MATFPVKSCKVFQGIGCTCAGLFPCLFSLGHWSLGPTGLFPPIFPAFPLLAFPSFPFSGPFSSFFSFSLSFPSFPSFPSFLACQVAPQFGRNETNETNNEPMYAMSVFLSHLQFLPSDLHPCAFSWSLNRIPFLAQ